MSLFITHTEVVLSKYMSLIGCLAVPLSGLGIVLGYTIAPLYGLG